MCSNRGISLKVFFYLIILCYLFFLPNFVALAHVKTYVIYSPTLTEAELKAALGSYLTTSIDTLCAKVSNNGSIDQNNIWMRNAAMYFAQLYKVSSESAAIKDTYVLKARKLLLEFAGHMPYWRLYQNDGTDVPQTGPIYEGDNGLWGRRDPAYTEELKGEYSIYFDLQSISKGADGGGTLCEAYYYIKDYTGTSKLTDTEKQTIRTKILKRHLDVQNVFGNTIGFTYGVTLQNYCGDQMMGRLNFEYVWNSSFSAAVHDAVPWLKAHAKVGYYADGFWSECAPGYHNMAFGNTEEVINKFFTDYSDPDGYTDHDGTRYDHLDMREVLASQRARSEYVRQTENQPNPDSAGRDEMFVIGDTYFNSTNWYAPKMTEATSILYGCMGHGILGRGTKNGSDINDLTQVGLHFGAMNGHDHGDILQFTLFAKSHELLSETEYKPVSTRITDTNAVRSWFNSSYGHNVVVIDETNQPCVYAMSQSLRRTKVTPDDDIPGIPDWPTRWTFRGCSLAKGDLLAYETDFPKVQMIEVDAKKAYGTAINGAEIPIYRRMLALVKIDDHDCYVVDIFRVKGGTYHDYMLHGCLEYPYTATVLNSSGNTLTLTKYPIDPIQGGNIHNTYSVNGYYDRSIKFALNGKTQAVRSFVLAQKDGGSIYTSIIRGHGQAMRVNGDANFIDIRRYAKPGYTLDSSTYVLVHHPYLSTSKISSVSAVSLNTTDTNAVALRVITTGGRTDTIIHTSSTSGASIATSDGSGITLKGRFGHISKGSSDPNWSWGYVVEGQKLVEADFNIPSVISYTGTLIATKRIEAGDADDTFLTKATLPTDGSLDGKVISVDLNDVITQNFTIDHVAVVDGNTWIYSVDEPGMTITGDLIKMEYFPNWGIRGTASFRIVGSDGYLKTEARTPSPKDRAVDVPVSTSSLSWTAATGASKYRIYLGTTSTPDYKAEQTGTSYNPGTLQSNTTYYWRVDVVRGTTVFTGHLWKFTVANKVSIDLGTTDISNWITHVTDPPFNGSTTAVTVGGRTCRKNIDPASDYYQYFKIDDNFVYNGNKQPLYLSIIYYDTGSGTIVLQYDSTDTSVPDMHYKELSSRITLGNTGQWKTYLWYLVDANFSNNQSEGADFRLSNAGTGCYLYIDKVEVGIPDVGINLGSTNDNEGISQVTGISDGDTQSVEIGGRDCQRTVNTSHDYYMYFAVDNSYAYNHNRPEVWLTIEYYDTGSGTIALSYDSTDPLASPNMWYKLHSKKIVLGNSGQWKRCTWSITDANFSDNQNGGADFRFDNQVSGCYLYIDKVSVYDPNIQ